MTRGSPSSASIHRWNRSASDCSCAASGRSSSVRLAPRIARGIERREIEEVIAAGEIIEDYARHHYGPACLILGSTSEGKALHLLCSVRATVDIITV